MREFFDENRVYLLEGLLTSTLAKVPRYKGKNSDVRLQDMAMHYFAGLINDKYLLYYK